MAEVVLALERVGKSFGGVRAVDGVSLEVRAGEVLSIIGPNGAGKTTLFNLISGVLSPDQGDVRFMGRSIRGLKPNRIARLGIGRTFQIVRPFPGLTVLDNVAVAALARRPALRDARRKAAEVLEFMGMSALAYVEARTLTLAGRKRLEIARALALEPRVILLDEVMAGLNPTELDQCLALLRRLSALGVGTVAGVEHVMRAVMRVSDRIAVMSSGRKIAEGTPADVVGDPEVVRAYLGSRAGSLAVEAETHA